MLRVLIIAFIALLRPLIGPPGFCRYKLSCTKYARLMLQDFPLYKAVPLILTRVMSCNPLTTMLARARRKRSYKH
jgi:putative component of membrane protein insertase Oxa1/YidC/SpoIIIJ protein YidD